MKDFNRIAEILANLTPEEVIHVVAKSQTLRNVPEPEPGQVPEAKVQEFKERYKNLVAIKQRRMPINISGHLVLDITLQDTYEVESIKLETDVENEVIKLINNIFNDASFYHAEAAIKDLQEKASTLIDETEASAEKYNDPELFEKVQEGLDHRFNRFPF